MENKLKNVFKSILLNPFFLCCSICLLLFGILGELSTNESFDLGDFVFVTIIPIIILFIIIFLIKGLEQYNKCRIKKTNINIDKNKNRILILVFWCNILCIPFAYIVTIIVSSYYNLYDLIRYFWIWWLFVPIPITSIILGFKYDVLGYKCKKNIIFGFIILILLLLVGSFYT